MNASFLGGLTLQGCSWSDTHASVVTDGSTSHPTGRLPFESLCLQGGEIDPFINWAASCLLRLRSLKFCLDQYGSLPKLLSSTLMNLELDIGLGGSCMSPLLTFPLNCSHYSYPC